MVDTDMLAAATAAILENPSAAARVDDVHHLRLVEDGVWSCLNESAGVRVNQLIDGLEACGIDDLAEMGDWVRAWARLDALFGYKLRRQQVIGVSA